MRTFSLACALLALTALAGCARQHAGYPRPVFQAGLFQARHGVCDSTGTPCARVRIDYLTVREGLSGPVRDSVDALVRSRLLSAGADGPPYASFQALADSFLGDYRSLQRAFPDYRTPWHLERRAVALHDTAGYVSIAITENTYAGGAHSSASTFYITLDLTVGRAVTLDELLIPDGPDTLTAIAERAFRQKRRLAPGVSLDSAGFWFEGNIFRLNDNFALGNSGLLFTYNQYEIAPYALGPTEIVIPYGELRHILRLRTTTP